MAKRRCQGSGVSVVTGINVTGNKSRNSSASHRPRASFRRASFGYGMSCGQRKRVGSVDSGFHAVSKFFGFLPAPASHRVIVQLHDPVGPVNTFFNSDKHYWHLQSARMSLCRAPARKQTGKILRRKTALSYKKIQIPTNVPVQRNVLRCTALKACLQGEPDAWM
nr:hypothetical protein [Pseudomonas viridiflava]